MEEFDRLVLRSMPHFVAVHYEKMLVAEAWPERIDEALCAFELGLRTLALGLVSQYLSRDAELFSDPALNQLLMEKLPVATLGTWQQVLVTALRAYEGRRDAFFMPEFYDFFWDTSSTPHRPRPKVQAPFARLVQIRSDLANQIRPTDETGWQQLGEETVGLLREVLAQFAFLERYELIRVTNRDQAGWHYQCYSGLEIVQADTPLKGPESEELKAGWFYLSKDKRRFLELHPLLIFWDEAPQHLALVADVEDEVALYERFLRDTVYYLTATLWDHINTPNTVGDFARKVFYVLEKVKMERLETTMLNWWQLQRTAQGISAQRMGGAREKYRADLYLQRDATKAAFDGFLASDKACFVLTGRSGVGKSNFLLSLVGEYDVEHPSVCLLMYNGATLDPARDLTSTVTADFESRLRITGREEETGIDNIWLEIERVPGVQDRTVVLVIDAINENMDGKALLRQINELVESSPWDWLKVVVTSRPEAWRNIKRRVHLAEGRYYRQAGQSALSFEMEPFTCSQELVPFAKEELPYAYDNYRRAYDLRSSYAELPLELREMLRDPLMLRLVAEVHQGQAISRSIDASEIYQEYTNVLIRTGRMRAEDVRFLEQELMPLMLGEGQYSNTIHASVIGRVRTSDGRKLFELIHGEEMLSSGWAVNASYRNLADAEILEQRGDPSDYEVGFRYERFYDYYAGKRLFELHHGKEERECAEAYRALVGQIQTHPFLWGAARNALLHELRAGNEGLIADLCYTEQQAMKEMMVVVLSDYGRKEGETTRSIIRRLVGAERGTAGVWNSWFRVRRERQIGLAVKNAKKVAIEVAEELGECDVLHIAARDANPSIRAHAARHIFHLWKQDIGRGSILETENRGLQILEDLIAHLTNRIGLPNIGVLESCLGVIFLIFMDSYREPKVCGELQGVCRRGLAKLLHISPEKRAGPVRARIRDWALLGAVKFVLSLLGDYNRYIDANVRETSNFFHLTQTEQSCLRDLLRYADPSLPLDGLRVHLLRALELNDFWISSAAWQILLIRGQSDTEGVFDTVKWFLDIAMKDSPSSYSVRIMMRVFPALIRQVVKDKQAFAVYGQLLDQRLRASKGRLTLRHTYITPSLHEYLTCAHALHITDFDLVYATLDRAKEENDTDLLCGVIWELGSMGMSDEYYQLVLRVLGALVDVEDRDVRQALLNLLARMRQNHADDVDDFVADHFSGTSASRQVRTMEAEEQIMDLLFVPAGYFLADAVRSPTFRNLIIWALARAQECRNLAQWVLLIGKNIINSVYGSEVYALPPVVR